MVMNGVRKQAETWIVTRPFAAFLLLVLSCLSLFGCSASAGKDQVITTTQIQPSPRPAEPAKETVLQSQAFNLQDLSVREERGQTILFVRFSQPVTEFRHFPLPQPSRIVLDLFGDVKQLPQVETFPIDTNWVATVRLTSIAGSLRLTLDIAGAAVPPYTIIPDQGGLKIVVGSVDPKAAARKNVTFFKDGKRTDGITSGPACPSTEELAPRPSPSEAQLTSEKKYTGQKISLEFKDADIKNIFRLIGEISGRNILVTDDVNQKVTIRLIEIPWDQALDLIINTNGLAKEEVDNIIRISTAARLTKDKRDQLDARSAVRSAEIPQTFYLNVNYAKVKDLVDKVKQIVKSGVDIVPDERSNTIIVRGSSREVQEVSCMVTRLDIRTPQVLIESNLIETTPTFARALGLRLQFTSGGTTFSSAAGAGNPFIGNQVAPGDGAPTGLGGTVSVIQNNFVGLRNLATALEAAESEGNIRIISRPSVVTLNNIASTIRSERILRIALPASTNIASGTGSSAAGAAVATEKVPVGIILTVIPQVSSDGYVLMNINVKSSTVAPATVPSGTAGVIPFDELNREAVANVLVKDGETIVLGGILKDTSQDSESGVPYLKDIPVLGWLFKNQRVQKDFEELMVFITPRLTSAGSANLPTAEQLWRDQLGKTLDNQSNSGTPTP
jgi:type IV pilus secretin PilQ/predicted competence protein